MGRIADRVRTAQDKDGMLRRALERIIQLYTDKSHFVYELLQNAEDAEAKCIRFIQYSDRLEVFHDGKPFTPANLNALCDIGKSDKVDNLNQIGEFGVGFKSVFGICDTVRLYSAPEHYRAPVEGDEISFAVKILDFTRPEDIPEEPLPRDFTTRFVFPYAVGQSFSGFATFKTLNQTLSYKLQNLGITTLLFMKNLEQIEYRIELGDEPITGVYLLEKTKINDHCLLVSALGSAKNQSTEGSTEEVISYLKFSRYIGRFEQRTVDIAFPVRIDKNGTYQCIKAPSPYVSVYFPTETESKLDFIVQGPYRTTPNRSSIPADDEDNAYLAEETAILLRQSLLELKNMGKLNMSFFKTLPISEERFINFGLFLPLYETVKEMVSSVAIVPSMSGRYIFAKYAKIARRGQLPTVFTDELLTQLINDGHSYYWLPTFLTETSSEYGHVYRYLTRVIGISVIAPEDLRTYISANPRFLPERTDDWLVQLYGIFEKIPAEFSKAGWEANMTTVEIVKTSAGKFVAPYRKEDRTYIPNVFLPSPNLKSADIHFVDQALYARCRHFFDDVLQLQKPNEYEFFIKDIEKRYERGRPFSDDQHIDDIKTLLKYEKYDEYSEEVNRIIRKVLALHCTDGKMRSTYAARIFLPMTADGINIEGYYRNIGQTVFFVDQEFYSLYNIDDNMLESLGVRSSLLIGENTTQGTYSTATRGKSPDWYTIGDFRWHLSADALKDVLRYISAHPTAKDSILKSQAIMKMLIINEARLCGRVNIGGGTPNLENEPCEMVHILKGDRMMGWNGKWLFTESGELVSPREISKHDISSSIYGSFKPDTVIFKLLGFKKTEDDEVDELKKTISQDKLDAFFESELKQRWGISSADLDARYGEMAHYEGPVIPDRLPFPSLHVRSWDALKKHAAEMLIYADPVRYEERVRSIRVSNRQKEARAYLQNMYRHEGSNRFKYACQLCHDTCSNFKAAEVFLNPETELDPLNLCLCPNCAEQYREFRSDERIMKKLRDAFLTRSEEDIGAGEYVAVSLNQEDELWFTQTHFAEIRELMRLVDEAKSSTKGKSRQEAAVSSSAVVEEENERSGLSVYSGYIGKTLRRKDGFVGVVKDLIEEGKDTYLLVHSIGGKDTGKDIKIQLSFILKNRGVYSISNEEAVTQG